MATLRERSDVVAARPTIGNYVVVAAVLGLAVFTLSQVLSQPAQPVTPSRLVPPIALLMGVTALVLVATALTRNVLVFLGKASMRYFHSYALDVPNEAAERPARAFNNLMQAPTVFYALCLIAMVQSHVDSVGEQLAWLYVGLRVVHAAQMIVWNFVPYRFALYAASSIVLFAFGWRVLEAGWPA